MMNKIIQGDCIEEIKKLDKNSVDAVITDPPYGLGFMGAAWDTFDKSQFGKSGEEGVNDLKVKKNFNILPRYNSDGLYDFVKAWAKEVIRVLKPGGYLLSFAGTRTYHKICMGIEDAGFEIRDMIEWVYGSGFPKSYNIGKKLENWKGWGTALKPAHEPIVMARKPLSEKTIVANVLKFGTGGINIDESRIDINNEVIPRLNKPYERKGDNNFGGGKDKRQNTITGFESKGRFPTNLIHDNSEEVKECFPNNSARFFKSIIYQAKASKSERNKGCEELDEKQTVGGGGGIGNYLNDVNSASGKYGSEKAPANNNHPTVKPIQLMRYLIKLVTPKGGIVLDHFSGSGTTLIAAKLEGMKFIGIEQNSEYVKIANARLKAYETKQKKLDLT